MKMTAASSENSESGLLQCTNKFTRFYIWQNGIVIHTARLKLPQVFC